MNADLSDAYMGTILSEIAFKDAIEWESDLFERGFDDVEVIRDFATSTDCYVTCNDKYLILCFRASREKEDWFKTNFDTTLEDTEYGPIHRGFHRSFLSVYRRVADAMDAMYRDQKVLIVGHSLGGALANVAALYLDHYIGIDQIYTYGQPRALSRKSAKYYDSNFFERSFRFSASGDFVSLIPYSVFPPALSYRHVGQHYYFSENGALRIEPVNWRVMRDWFKDLVSEVFKADIFNFEDHSISRYKKLILEKSNTRLT